MLAAASFVATPFAASADFIIKSMGDVSCSEFATSYSVAADSDTSDDERERRGAANHLVHAYINGYFQARYDLSADPEQSLQQTVRGYIDNRLFEYCSNHPTETIHEVLVGGHLSPK
jgi:hypothetical protein